MNAILTGAVFLSCLAWGYLLLGRGRFWRADQRLGEPPAPRAWPAVVAVVPARDEAAGVGACVRALLAQDYPGPFRVVLVDDNSSDGTAEIARRAAVDMGADDRFTVISGKPLEPGWAGKLWAVSQGVEAAERADYLWLTDGDIVHGPSVLRRLVAKAETQGVALVSLMVMLSRASPWERLLIPAFVFFFQKLYPFPWVNDPRRRTAGAAGGCMLVRRDILQRAGGIAAIRSALIDDCALAALVKPLGPIWLGLGTDSVSLRPYVRLAEIWHMVARSAYTQLGYSPWRLAGTVLGMSFLYLLPPVAVPVGMAMTWPAAAILGLVGWLLMAGSYVPTVRLYGQPAVLALSLPLAAALYTLMTVDSARRHWLGRGGGWKGRVY